ncbi:MAG: sigma-70 family RNA polymerase sigma factor [Phycisphaerae bacterium]|nr:sigma-70 family RNA polymerase sigma factor [Phycisphaerae bacterium]
MRGQAGSNAQRWASGLEACRMLLLDPEALEVAGYTLEMIQQLARQLLMSPPRLRLQQIEGAEYLIDLIEPRRTYPYDLVLFHVTQFRRKVRTDDENLLPGKPLISDLVQLVDDLSASTDLMVHHIDQACWTVEQLGERLRVSHKTLNRWHRRGLVSYRAVDEEGRRRMVFPERAVRRFVRKNPALVTRAASFSKLTDEERQSIVERARELIEDGLVRVSEVAERLAKKLGRSTETIRYILRRHDQEHPEDRLFGRPPEPLGSEDHLKIYRCYRSGDAVADLARRFARKPSAVYRIITEIRARELLRQDIEYIPSDEFDDADADAMILGGQGSPAKTDNAPRKRPRPTGDLPTYLKELYDLPLLQEEQERDLFRRYNYVKFKAKRLAETIDPRQPRAADLNDLESLLNRAEDVRNRIIQANLRLVVSIAKKHIRNGDDLFVTISDGNLSLMRAVEKFDYTRGFRFSTYASWAIMRNYARTIPEERFQRSRCQTGHEERLDIEPDRQDAVAAADRRMEGIRESLDEVLKDLPTRERMIICRHYGLMPDGKCQTLEQIGRLFGVSKERARQLEKRALKKLRLAVSPSMLEAVLS